MISKNPIAEVTTSFAHQSVTRPLWLCIGALALGLGAIGAVLPLLPTAPFMIVAAFAFGKSAPRAQQWLEQHRVFGPIIVDWQLHGAIAPRYKALAFAMMGCALGLSVAMGIPIKILVVQALFMAAAAIFILSRPNRMA